MHCEKILLLLSDYIDKLLSDVEQKNIQQHLSACENCQQEYTKLEKTIMYLRNLPRLKAPSHVRENIIQKVEKTSDTKKLLSHLRVLSMAAGLLLSLCLGILVVQDRMSFQKRLAEADNNESPRNTLQKQSSQEENREFSQKNVSEIEPSSTTTQVGQSPVVSNNNGDKNLTEDNFDDEAKEETLDTRDIVKARNIYEEAEAGTFAEEDDDDIEHQDLDSLYGDDENLENDYYYVTEKNESIEVVVEAPGEVKEMESSKENQRAKDLAIKKTEQAIKIEKEQQKFGGAKDIEEKKQGEYLDKMAKRKENDTSIVIDKEGRQRYKGSFANINFKESEENCIECHKNIFATLKSNVHANSFERMRSNPETTKILHQLNTKSIATCLQCHAYQEQENVSNIHCNSCHKANSASGGARPYRVKTAKEKHVVIDWENTKEEHVTVIDLKNTKILLDTCYRCHHFENEDLIDAGHPTTRIDITDAVNTKIKHYPALNDLKTEEMMVVERLYHLANAVKSFAKVRKNGKYSMYAFQTVNIAYLQLLQIQKQVSIKEIDTTLEKFRQTPKKIGDHDTLMQLAITIEETIDSIIVFYKSKNEK